MLVSVLGYLVLNCPNVCGVNDPPVQVPLTEMAHASEMVVIFEIIKNLICPKCCIMVSMRPYTIKFHIQVKMILTMGNNIIYGAHLVFGKKRKMMLL